MDSASRWIGLYEKACGQENGFKGCEGICSTDLEQVIGCTICGGMFLPSISSNLAIILHIIGLVLKHMSIQVAVWILHVKAGKLCDLNLILSD